jgi:acetyl-CoA carboxylase carboxyl transferase subunit alpha
MAAVVLPFEAPVVELLDRVRELRVLAATEPHFAEELGRVEQHAEKVARELFRALSPMQKVQVSRHGQRPYMMDYVSRLCTDFIELHGDRRFSDDAAIIGGLAKYRGRSVVVVGHQKGRTTRENVARNFGMAHPEGYRKAIRLFEMADRFRLPVLTFIDTPGAYPGIGAEERGQSEAIGASLAVLSRLGVPVIATVTGEGGSGGALALGLANRVLMLEFGCYTVITPEGCAAILWKDGNRAADAADVLRLTAPDLLRLGVIDEMVAEPAGGAHQDHDAMAKALDAAISTHLDALVGLDPAGLAQDRYDRFRRIGVYGV